MVEYNYSIRSDPDKKTYESEEELKEANPDVCDPDKHNWKSTFVFGTYECRECDAIKSVR